MTTTSFMLPHNVRATVLLRSHDDAPWQAAPVHTKAAVQAPGRGKWAVPTTWLEVRLATTYTIKLQNMNARMVGVGLYIDGRSINADTNARVDPGETVTLTGFARNIEDGVWSNTIPFRFEEAPATLRTSTETTGGMRAAGRMLFRCVLVDTSSSRSTLVSGALLLPPPGAAAAAGSLDGKKFSVVTPAPSAAAVDTSSAYIKMYSSVEGTQRDMTVYYGDRAALLLNEVIIPTPEAARSASDGDAAPTVKASSVVDLIDLTGDAPARGRAARLSVSTVRKIKACVNDGRFVLKDVLIRGDLLRHKSDAARAELFNLIETALKLGVDTIKRMWDISGNELDDVTDLGAYMAAEGNTPPVVVVTQHGREPFDAGLVADGAGRSSKRVRQ